MMARSLAEKYRAHDAEMKLAMQLGITPKEARAELDRRAAQERWRETRRRMAQRAGRIDARHEARRDDPVRLRDLPDERWMLRD